MQRIWALRAYRDAKAAVNDQREVRDDRLVELLNSVMHVRAADGDL